MAIKIHQAICGEHNKGWDLLKTTLSDISIARKIAFQTDLQDSPPSGLQWLPVIRGFSFADYFLLIKTYPDNSSDVRNGRVFSHCLIINKTDLKNISDLSPLLSVFQKELDKNILLEPIILRFEQQAAVVLTDALQHRFNRVIQSFIKFASNAEPLVWVGQEHFELAVCKLWQMLSSSKREDFHFGINFNASEVAKDKMSFVVIPDNAEKKFENKGFTLIRKEDFVELKEFSEQFLAGESNATGRIEDFIKAIEAPKPSHNEISTIAKGVQTFENFEREKNLKLLNTLANIVAKFSSDGRKGTAFKAKLVEQIALLAERADESDIFILRNFQIKSFKGSEKRLSHSIDKWCSDYLLNEQQNQKVNYVPFIVQIAESPQKNWLIKLLSNNISTFLSKLNIASAKIVWRWLTNDVAILKSISSTIENTTAAEEHLYITLPKTDDKVLSEVKTFSVQRAWFRLHAAILKSQFDFIVAIKEQIKVDTDSNNFEGIKIIAEGAKPYEVISFSVISGDKRLIHLSGKLCNTNSKLLADIQIENRNWQDVWLVAINNGNKVFDGIKEPEKVAYFLFDLMIAGKSTNEGLLEKISDTEFGNILQYHSRNRLWSILPSKVKSKFLEKTSITLLRGVSENSIVSVPLEIELSNYMVSTAIPAFLQNNSGNIKSVLPIFNTYSHLQEYVLRDYVSNYKGRIDVVDASQLGQYVRKRKYSKVAYAVMQKARSNKQYKVALEQCYHLLDLWTQGVALVSGLIFNVSVSPDEWWTSFIQLAFTLYDEGPTQNKIWTQADGKGYDLQTKGSGKDVWIAALQKLRKKNCAGGITVKKLLNAMLSENKKNEELRTLKDLWDKI